MAQPTVNLAGDLIRIHKVITRSLEVSLETGKGYQSAGFPQPQVLAGYTTYIQCLAGVLSGHHTGEDLIIFPEARKVIPNAPYEQYTIAHHSVETLLSELRLAIAQLSGDSPEVGLSAALDTIAKISAVWHPHIQSEEENFSEEKVNVAFSQAEQKSLGEATGKLSQEKSGPPYWVVPFVLFNLDQEERAKMAAALPPTIMSELVPKIWVDQWAPMKPFLLE